MSNIRLWIVLGTLTGGSMILSGAARCQDFDTSAIHYGDGVHAYFAGNSARAEQSLSNALTMDSQDPRIYYFRALSLLRQGRTAEARGDMMVGAALEAQRPQRFAVGAALERVQGHDRLVLEQFRRQARSEAGVNGAGRQSISAEPPGALRQRVVIPLNEYLQPGAPRPAGATTSAAPRTFAPTTPQPPATGGKQAPADTSQDPFQDDPQRPADRTPVVPPAPTQPTNTAPADSSDPFESSATEAARRETTTTPNMPPAEAPADSSGGDPFGTP